MVNGLAWNYRWKVLHQKLVMTMMIDLNCCYINFFFSCSRTRKWPPDLWEMPDKLSATRNHKIHPPQSQQMQQREYITRIIRWRCRRRRWWSSDWCEAHSDLGADIQKRINWWSCTDFASTVTGIFRVSRGQRGKFKWWWRWSEGC